MFSVRRTGSSGRLPLEFHDQGIDQRDQRGWVELRQLFSTGVVEQFRLWRRFAPGRARNGLVLVLGATDGSTGRRGWPRTESSHSSFQDCSQQSVVLHDLAQREKLRNRWTCPGQFRFLDECMRVFQGGTPYFRSIVLVGQRAEANNVFAGDDTVRAIAVHGFEQKSEIGTTVIELDGFVVRRGSTLGVALKHGGKHGRPQLEHEAVHCKPSLFVLLFVSADEPHISGSDMSCGPKYPVLVERSGRTGQDRRADASVRVARLCRLARCGSDPTGNLPLLPGCCH
jgi:hypothetical protein